MTQTLTTEQLIVIASGEFDACSVLDASVSMARELLANREAQPVASREHFESLCNQFWNWTEFDEINTEEEPRLKWDGKKYSHRVTAALWRMYQAAPPAPVVPTPVNFSENTDADTCRKWAWEQVKELVSADGWTLGDSITYFGFFCWGWDMRRQYNEQRPSQLTGATAVPDEMTKDDAMAFVRERPPFKGSVDCVQATWNACRAAMLAQPVSQGCELPDNVREALTLALQAMEFMGDTLNNIDAVCTEDVEYVTPAFTAVRGLLPAAPEGGNG